MDESTKLKVLEKAKDIFLNLGEPAEPLLEHLSNALAGYVEDYDILSTKINSDYIYIIKRKRQGRSVIPATLQLNNTALLSDWTVNSLYSLILSIDKTKERQPLIDKFLSLGE